MKKLTYILISALVLTLASCHKTTPADVAQKISEGSELTQEDYAVILDTSAEMIESITDTIGKYSDNSQRLMSALFELKNSSNDADVITTYMSYMDPSVLDQNNRKRYDALLPKISALQSKMQEIVGPGLRVREIGPELQEPENPADPTLIDPSEIVHKDSGPENN